MFILGLCVFECVSVNNVLLALICCLNVNALSAFNWFVCVS